MPFESTRIEDEAAGQVDLKRKLEATRERMKKLKHEEETLLRQIEANAELDEEQIEYLDEDFCLPEEPDISSIKEMKNLSMAVTQQSQNVAKLAIRYAGLKELPKFSGNIDEWANFYAQYVKTTSDGQFTSSENVTRLEKCLSGEARELVASLLTVSGEAESIIAILKERFGHPRQQLQRLIQRAKQAEAPNDNKPISVVKFAAEVRNVAIILQTLNEGRHVQDSTIVNEFERKLTPIMKNTWAEVICTNPDYTVLDLMKFLNTRAKLALAITPLDGEGPSTSRHKPEEEKRPKFRGKGVFTVTSAGRGKCAVCQGNHYTSECPEFKNLSPKERFVKTSELNLCRSCLGRNHRMYRCFKRRECGVEGCRLSHHHLLHSKAEGKEETKKETAAGCRNDIRRDGNMRNEGMEVLKPNDEYNTRANSRMQEQQKSVRMRVNDNIRENNQQLEDPSEKSLPFLDRVCTTAKTLCRGIVMLRIVPVTVRNIKTGIMMETLALLDSGATVTLIDKSITKELHLVGQSTAMNLQWLDGTTHSQSVVKQVYVEVKGQHSQSKWYKLNECYAVDRLHLPEVKLCREELIQSFPYLEKVEFKSIHGHPKILIGENHATLIATHQLVHDVKNTPVASLTPLGWVISGVIEDRKRRCPAKNTVCHISDDRELIELIKSSFSLDNVGIKHPIKPLICREDEEALEILRRTTKRVGQRFEAGLLWKTPRKPMPDSRPQAIRRDQQICLKMARDIQFEQAYTERMKYQIEENRLLPLNEDDRQLPSTETWYLPHFGVENPNKSKMRIVLDAAAEVEGVSLNSRLLSGPNLIKPLQNVLMHFRTGEHGFTGDIKDMFPQISIRKEDQNFQRVMYHGTEYKMTAMTFGATCSPATAVYVKDLNALEWGKEYPEARLEITDHHYVDDYLGSHDNEEKAIQLILDVIEVHRRGGFEIRNFVSSSQKILNEIPANLRLQTPIVNMDFEQQMEKVLGLWWEPLTDVFSFRCQYEVSTDIPTKREALRTLMRVYDPLGFVAQFVSRGRIIFQQVWRSGIGWDEKLPDEIYKTWKSWTIQLSQLNEVEVPRCLASALMRKERLELHIFTDASEDAIAAVAYLRCITDHAIHVSFVMAKTKVAPLKAVSIARLELQGALIGSRLATYITTEYKVDICERRFWTDSTIVLQWIKSDSRTYKPFVGNRVGEIQETTETSEWKWVPTELNVADIATRDKGETNFSSDSSWYRGPDFLYSRDIACMFPRRETDNEEVDKEFIGVTSNVKWEAPIDSSKYLKWDHLHRVAAYVYRFVRACKEKWRTKPYHAIRPSTKFLSATDWKGGEMYLLRIAQWESFRFNMTDDAVYDQRGFRSLRIEEGNPLFPLNPVMDSNGLLRADGRLNYMPHVSAEFKNPIILHAENRIVQLMMTATHERLGHWGVDYTLSELRTRFHIIKGRVSLKGIQSGCKQCQMNRVKPQMPIMGQLPSERLEMHVIPFQYTGCDMFGPMYVRRGRSELKRYGCIFTCLSTRAVHLEMCNDLTTDSFLLALRRFFARRTVPVKIISDCGSNFRGADKELRREAAKLNHEKIAEKMAQLQIEWQFNPPLAPHMGGCWERMVGLVKKVIKQTTELSKHLPSEEVLTTLLAEAENIVNSRPLLILSDSGESLTPNHFLKHQKSTSTAGGKFEDTDLILSKEWRKAQRLTDHFWQIWLKYYAPTLTNRPKWRKDGEPVKVGDRVVVVDPNLPRNIWPTGRIISTTESQDGKIRVVRVKMEEDGREYTRPVSRLAVLQPPTIMSEGKDE